MYDVMEPMEVSGLSHRESRFLLRVRYDLMAVCPRSAKVSMSWLSPGDIRAGDPVSRLPDQERSRPCTSATIASCSGVGTPTRRPSAAIPPLRTSTSVGRRARTSWSMSACARRHRRSPRRRTRAGSRVSVDAGRLADGQRLVDEPVDLVAQRRDPCRPGPTVSPVSAGQRAGGRVEHDLRPLRTPGVVERVRREAALGEQAGEPGDLVGRAGLRLERARARSPPARR